MLMRLTVNGAPVAVETPPTTPLLHVLRDRLGLMGAKEACGQGECGACTVLMDGQAVNACLVMAARADGTEVLTVEGLADQPGMLHPIQQAFLEAGAVQCGYCMPGMVLNAYALLRENPRPTPAEVRAGMAGNLCRCTGYQKILAAVQLAAERGAAK